MDRATLALSPSQYLALVALFARQWNACGTVGTGPNGSDGSTFYGRPHTGTALVPNVDLLLRTGGERRLSDFLLWECAYAELAFLDVHFPDLANSDLDTVFADYAARDRRFGGLNVTPAPA
jgi:undecaprenyl diphosphate synthase